MVVSGAGENALSVTFDLQPMKELRMKEDPKLTPWFPPQVKPVRIGYYEVKHFLDGVLHEGYAMWTGSYWSYLDKKIYYGPVQRWGRSVQQNKMWRGLAEEPK